MFTHTLISLHNYLRTFIVLLREFARFSSKRLLLYSGAVVVAGSLYPLPFLLLVAALFSLVSNQLTVQFPRIDQLPSLTLLQAFLLAMVSGITAYIMSLYASNKIIDVNIAWQNQLFSRCIDLVGGELDLNFDLSFLPGRRRRLIAFFARSVRSGALIGRLISNGLYNLTTVTVATAVLLWFRYEYFLIAVLTSLAFLPIYARELFAMISVRESMEGQRVAARERAMEILTKATQPDEGSNEATSISKVLSAKLESSYAIINEQYLKINGVQFWSSLHILSVIACLFGVSQYFSWSFGVNEGFAIVAIVVAVRAGAGFIGLLANITRNYAALVQLRTLCDPSGKAMLQNQNLTEDALLLVETSATRLEVQKGAIIFFTAPNVDSNLGLLWLTGCIYPNQKQNLRSLQWAGHLNTRQVLQLLTKRTHALLAISQSQYGTLCTDKEFVSLAMHTVVLVHVRPQDLAQEIERSGRECVFIYPNENNLPQIATLGGVDITLLGTGKQTSIPNTELDDVDL